MSTFNSASTASGPSSIPTIAASSSATSACRRTNLLTPPRGDGLTIAYHGLNLGRIALCANAAGTVRLMMASMIPWANFRETYGQTIAQRELRAAAARPAGGPDHRRRRAWSPGAPG